MWLEIKRDLVGKRPRCVPFETIRETWRGRRRHGRKLYTLLCSLLGTYMVKLGGDQCGPIFGENLKDEMRDVTDKHANW